MANNEIMVFFPTKSKAKVYTMLTSGRHKNETTFKREEVEIMVGCAIDEACQHLRYMFFIFLQVVC